MKSKFLLTIALAMVLTAFAPCAFANLLQNPGFDDGADGQIGTGYADFWTGTGTAGWHHADDESDQPGGVVRFLGVRTFKIWGPTSVVYQDFPCTAGLTYNFSVDVLSPSADNSWGGTDRCNGREAQLWIDWYDFDGGSVISVDIIDRSYFTDGLVPEDPDDVWVTLSGTAQAPAGATVGRFVNGVIEESPWTGAPNFENAVAEVDALPEEPTNLQPSGFADPSATMLTWDAPQAQTGNITYKVYVDFTGVEDPNKLTGLACPEFVATDQTSGGPISATTVALSQELELNKTYYWYVDAIDDGTSVTTSSRVASFNTNNTPPIVDAGPAVTLWCSGVIPKIPSRTITTAPTVVDDGLPGGTGYPSYSWTCTGGITPASPGSEITNIVFPDPLDASEIYEVTLTFNDGSGPVSDSFSVVVVGSTDDAVAAHWNLDDAAGTVALEAVSGNDGVGTSQDGLTNPTAAVAGKVGTAFEFDDSLEQYIEIPGSGYMTDPNNAGTWVDNINKGLTVSYWMKSSATDGTGASGMAWAGTVNRDSASWEFQRDGGSNDGQLVFACGNGVGITHTYANGITTNAFDGQWHNIVGTYDGNNVKVYIDGLLADSVTASPNAITGAMELSPGASNITIGRNNYLENEPDSGNADIGGPNTPDEPDTWGHDYFAGSIDQVKILSAALPERSPYANVDGIVEIYRAEGGMTNCGGIYTLADLDKDCYVGLSDILQLAGVWMECSDISNAYCDQF